jgi:hypothetical protein
MRQKVSNTIIATNIKRSTWFHAGVWMSKSPDHDIIVMDIEGFSKKELEQEKVDWRW